MRAQPAMPRGKPLKRPAADIAPETRCKRPSAAASVAKSSSDSGGSPLWTITAEMLKTLGPSKQAWMKKVIQSFDNEICIHSLCSGSEVQGFSGARA